MTTKYDQTIIDKIAQLWATNISTKLIGRRLKIPKNSICRLAQKARKQGDTRFPVRGLKAPSIRRAPLDAPRKPPTMKPKIIEFPTVRTTNRRDPRPLIWELKPFQCRYPVHSGKERGEHYFCAAPTDGKPYCAEHDALCNNPVRGKTLPTTWAKPA